MRFDLTRPTAAHVLARFYDFRHGCEALENALSLSVRRNFRFFSTVPEYQEHRSGALHFRIGRNVVHLSPITGAGLRMAVWMIVPFAQVV